MNTQKPLRFASGLSVEIAASAHEGFGESTELRKLVNEIQHIPRAHPKGPGCALLGKR